MGSIRGQVSDLFVYLFCWIDLIRRELWKTQLVYFFYWTDFKLKFKVLKGSFIPAI